MNMSGGFPTVIKLNGSLARGERQIVELEIEQKELLFLLKKHTHCIEYSKNKTNVQIKDVLYYE